MLMWLKRLFFGDDRLFLRGSHLARVIRDDKFYSVPDVGEIVDGPNTCQLVLDVERDGTMRIFVGGDCASDRDSSNLLSSAVDCD